MLCLGLSQTAEQMSRRAQISPCHLYAYDVTGEERSRCMLYDGHEGGCFPRQEIKVLKERPAVCCDWAGWGVEASPTIKAQCPLKCPCHHEQCHPRTNLRRPFLKPLMPQEQLDNGFYLACRVRFGMTQPGAGKHWETLLLLPDNHVFGGLYAVNEKPMVEGMMVVEGVSAYDILGNLAEGYFLWAKPVVLGLGPVPIVKPARYC